MDIKTAQKNLARAVVENGRTHDAHVKASEAWNRSGRGDTSTIKRTEAAFLAADKAWQKAKADLERAVKAFEGDYMAMARKAVKAADQAAALQRDLNKAAAQEDQARKDLDRARTETDRTRAAERVKDTKKATDKLHAKWGAAATTAEAWKAKIAGRVRKEGVQIGRVTNIAGPGAVVGVQGVRIPEGTITDLTIRGTTVQINGKTIRRR